jgi:uridylate kinase
MILKMLKHKRVLVKISGEALMGSTPFGHDHETVKCIAEDLRPIISSGVELCITVGGGNICRGSSTALLGIDRAAADYMGMLATVINAVALQNVMEQAGIHTRVLSAVPMIGICEPYVSRRARRHMEKGRAVIFAAGTGNPFFTTDSAAVLRAIEMQCDLLLKATQVDGVYDLDPKKYPEAVRYESISYTDILKDNLQVMDMAAIALARENNLPIKVFSIKERGSFMKALRGEGGYTEIS